MTVANELTRLVRRVLPVAEFRFRPKGWVGPRPQARGFASVAVNACMEMRVSLVHYLEPVLEVASAVLGKPTVVLYGHVVCDNGPAAYEFRPPLVAPEDAPEAVMRVEIMFPENLQEVVVHVRGGDAG